MIPWHTLCIDLIGPYTFGEGDDKFTLLCLTMMDPATGWFEIVKVIEKQADIIANLLEFMWLTRYPWPTEIVMDRGSEFAAEVRETLKNEYGIHRKIITAQNPQANSMIERAHQTIGNFQRTLAICSKADLDKDFGWLGILSAIHQAMHATVHTTTRATSTQLVFGCDALLNVSFKADWQCIKERKQQRILQNNRRENATRRDHDCSAGDKVLIRLPNGRKFGKDLYSGPHTVTPGFANNTVRLSKAAKNGGVICETCTIRNLTPCMD